MKFTGTKGWSFHLEKSLVLHYMIDSFIMHRYQDGPNLLVFILVLVSFLAHHEHAISLCEKQIFFSRFNGDFVNQANEKYI